MARAETVLSVFLASPGDVADARKRLEKVVDELNYIWSRQYRLRLELVKWETHAYSDIGIDAQDVINRQLRSLPSRWLADSRRARRLKRSLFEFVSA